MTVDGRPVGVVGEVDPGVLEAYGIPGRVAWLELDLTVLLDLEPAIPQWRARQPLPVERHRPGLRRRRRRHRRRPPRRRSPAPPAPLLVDLDLFDVYRGPGIPAGQRSLAFRIRLQAADHTLTDAEVAAVREAIIAAAAAKGATLRA